jgi:hypothetical protein
MAKLVSILAISLIITSLVGCGQKPRLDASAEIRKDRIIFVLSIKDINVLLHFRVKDESGNQIWDVHLSYDMSHEIEYGVLPTNGNMAARQLFPPEDKQPVNIRGKTVIVSIEYQYDAIAPSAGTFKKTLKIPQ